MNELGRNALRAAALAGVRQIRGQLRDATDGRCAFGVLEECGGPGGVADMLMNVYGIGPRAVYPCPLCQGSPRREWMLLLHLNDFHRCDFLKIASLMPVSEAQP